MINSDLKRLMDLSQKIMVIGMEKAISNTEDNKTILLDSSDVVVEIISWSFTIR